VTEREREDERAPRGEREGAGGRRPGPLREARPSPSMDGYRVLRDLRERLFGR